MNIDVRELTKLALKLAGLYILVTTLTAVPSLIATPRAFTTEWGLSLGLYGLIGVALFLIPGRIVSDVIHLPSDATQGALSAEKLARVGAILLGVYFTVGAIFGLVHTYAKARLHHIWFWPHPGSRGPDLTPDDFGYLVANAIELVIGLLLWFGSRYVIRAAYWSRHDR
jgi:hypothetical protein